MTPTGMTANILRSIEKRHRGTVTGRFVGASIVQIQNDCNLLLKWANELEKKDEELSEIVRQLQEASKDNKYQDLPERIVMSHTTTEEEIR